jgi:hypothetical protein
MVVDAGRGSWWPDEDLQGVVLTFVAVRHVSSLGPLRLF